MILLNFFSGFLKKGPPDAVINIFSISSSLQSRVNSLIEKCSESIGIISVFFCKQIFLIICQPHMIDSLLANNIFLLILVNLIVGSRPAIPTIPQIEISIFSWFIFKFLNL